MAIRNRIVVGTDFSTGARTALARARQLARDHGAELIVVHSVPVPSAGAPPGLPTMWSPDTRGHAGPAVPERGPHIRRRRVAPTAPPEMAPEPSQADVAGAAVELAERQLGRVEETTDGVRIRTRMSYGQAHADILRIAEEEQAGLVVTGTHRPRGAFERFFLGSTAERVLRLGAFPVLVVRRRALAPYRSVVVPVDFSTNSSLTLQRLRRLLPRVRPLVLHVLAPTESNGAAVPSGREAALERLRKLVRSVGYATGEAQVVAVTGDARTEILATARRAEADLIAMGTHGRTGLERLLLGSVAEYVIRAFPGDVLAVPPKAE